MSELANFLKKKYKTQASFDKKFGGDGRAAMKLLETIGKASPAVNKEAQKIFRENPDDIAKGVAAIRRAVYGESGAKTGVRGKTASNPEVLEGNLPSNDPAVVADPPKGKGKAKAAGGSTRAANKEEVVAEVGNDETGTPIGQFVPFTQDVVGQTPDFSISTNTADLLRGAQSMQTPTGEIDRILQSPPAPMPRQAIPQDVADVAAQAEVAPDAASQRPSWMDSLAATQPSDLSMLLDDSSAATPPVVPNIDPFAPPENPVDFAALDFEWMGPLATRQTASQALAGLMEPPSPAAALEAPAPQSRPTMDMSRLADPALQYSSQRAPGAPPRPPFYDPTRSWSEWWKSPGPVSRANEFLYQRGMPASVARAVQPTASAIDAFTKVAAPLAVAGGAAAAAMSAGGKALQYMGGGLTEAPPSDEQMADLAQRIRESEARVRGMMQPPRKNPASAPLDTPVQ